MAVLVDNPSTGDLATYRSPTRRRQITTPLLKQGLVDRLSRWLQTHERWLLIFDNAASLDEVTPYLPRAGSGHILITSRYPAWRPRAAVIEVDVYQMEEAVEFLCRRLSRTTPEERSGAAAVAAMLGCLPLALEQAAGYMEERKLPLPQQCWETSRCRSVGRAGSCAPSS